MGATVQIHEMTATNDGVDKTSGTVRFKSADETATGTTNRLVIPAADTDYSYTKHLMFKVTVAPSVDIQNLRAYVTDTTDFDAYTGISVEYDVNTQYSANTDADIEGGNLFSTTDPIDMDATGTSVYTETGYYGQTLRLQMHVASTASPGVLTAAVLTFAYDET